MLGVYHTLKVGEKPVYSPNSSWESGGYTPYNSKEGRREHDFLINQIRKIIKNK